MSRVIPGILLAAGWILLLLYGSPLLFWSVVTLGAVIALHEYFRMTDPQLAGSRLLMTMTVSLLPMLSAFGGSSDAVQAGLFGSLAGTVLVAMRAYGALDHVFRFLSSSCFGALYISFCAAHVVLLRYLSDGPFWLIMLMAMVAGSDTGAYYAGRAFGRKKLFPQISPKKTVAGGIGGLLAGMAAALIVSLLCAVQVQPLRLLVAALVLIVVGIIGDLAESMIKRSTGVKDSGAILGGHGGLLDRIDSLLLTAPLLYYLLHFGLLA